MRIIIFNWRDMGHPQRGGAELFIHEIGKRLVKRGHHVTQFGGAWEGCESETAIEGVHCVRRGGKFSVYVHALWWYLKNRKKFDVIIDVENGIPFFTPLFSHKPKVCLIHHVHKDVWQIEMPFPLSKIGYFLEMKLMPWVYRNVRGITVSPSSKQEIEKYKLVGKKVDIVYNATNLEEPSIQWEKFKSPTILFLNRMKKYKGVDVVIEAAKKVPANFVIAGSGDYLEEAKLHAKDLKNVTFLGRVSEEEKTKLMQQAWIFVNPSHKEGWSIVNIEANFYGLPVVGSNVGGICDSVKDGKTGLLFKEGDANDLAEKLTTLICYSQLRDKMSQEAKKWARSFSYDDSAAQVEWILGGLC